MTVIHYYSRRGCHLCEIMLEELLPLVQGNADIEVRDVDTVPEWRQKYDVRVPVIEVGDRLVSEYPLDREALFAAIAATGDE